MSHSPVQTGRHPLRVVIAIDVEEDALFTGSYPRRGAGVSNVQALTRLQRLAGDLGFPVTLLCSWPVLADKNARRVLGELERTTGAEIGAHLHHWNTPPLASGPDPTDPSSALISGALMEAKLQELLRAAAELRGRPVCSFRMGRWDLRPNLWPLLARSGIRVDSSVHPMRHVRGGPDHFMAPGQPFRVRVDGREMLEMPICAVPLHPALPRLTHTLAARTAVPGAARMPQGFSHWGCLQLKPVWVGLHRLQWATRLLVSRGGTVLSLFWHSSEMMAGCTPQIATPDQADRLMHRIESFLLWLRRTYAVQALTMESLGRMADTFPLLERVPSDQAGDWCPPELTS